MLHLFTKMSLFMFATCYELNFKFKTEVFRVTGLGGTLCILRLWMLLARRVPTPRDIVHFMYDFGVFSHWYCLENNEIIVQKFTNICFETKLNLNFPLCLATSNLDLLFSRHATKSPMNHLLMKIKVLSVSQYFLLELRENIIRWIELTVRNV